MQTLEQILLGGTDKDAVIADFVRLMEDFIANRGGLKGMGMRAGFKMLKAARPDVLDRATVKLLPEFLRALEPFHEKFVKAKEKDFGAFLQRNEKSAAAALMKVADDRAARASDTVQGYYDKFRSGADGDVQKIVAPLGKLVQKHLKH